jgi:predicted ATPase with chaperone activity
VPLKLNNQSNVKEIAMRKFKVLPKDGHCFAEGNPSDPVVPAIPTSATDFALVKGQEACKRAIAVALVGHHSVVLWGGSGHGKTMLVRCAHDIDSTFTAVEVTLWRSGNVQQNIHQARRLAQLATAGHIHIEVPNVPFREMASKRPGTDTKTIHKQVEEAREFGTTHKSEALSDSCLLLMKQAYDELRFTPRTFTVVSHIARSIANLDRAAFISDHHLAEALQYRLLDRETSAL